MRNCHLRPITENGYSNGCKLPTYLLSKKYTFRLNTAYLYLKVYVRRKCDLLLHIDQIDAFYFVTTWHNLCNNEACQKALNL